MPDTMTSEVTELADPKLRSIAGRVVRTLRLAAERAVAHHAEPENYPIPSEPDSLEQLFLSRFRQLPDSTQKAAVTKVMSFVKSPTAVRIGRYDDFAIVDFTSAKSVEAQLQVVAFPKALTFPAKSLSELAGLLPSASAILNAAAVSADMLDALEFRIRQVRCLDETGGWPELGDDEIYLGATTIDETGDTKKVTQFKVGDFHDGDVVNFSPPKRLTWFNLKEGTEWPKTYYVTLVLAEVNEVGLTDFLNKLVEKVRERVVGALSSAIGAAIGSSGGPVGAVIGAVVGYVIGEIFGWLKSWWQDDIFDPITAKVTIPSARDLVPGKLRFGLRTVYFTGHDGKYSLSYDWSVSRKSEVND